MERINGGESIGGGSVGGGSVGGGSVGGGSVGAERGAGNTGNIRTVTVRRIYVFFVKVALSYGRLFPKSVRRFIEFLVLMKALWSFAILVYIHLIFTRAPATCLDKVRSSWPRHGILRVEITKEEINDANIAQFDYVNNIFSNIASSPPSSAINQSSLDVQPTSASDLWLKDSIKYQTLLKSNVSVDSNINEMNFSNNYEINISPRNKKMQAIKISSEQEVFLSKNETVGNLYRFELNNDSLFKNEPVINGKPIKAPASDDEHIFEFSLEDGLLRLSPATRKKLNIAVMCVTLDATTDSCFGDEFSRFILGELIGYKDLIMSSFLALVEDEDTTVYVRNVITGEYWRGFRMRTANAYIAFILMIILTVSVSLLLRYIIFLEDILEMLEYNLSIIFPVTPLRLTIIFVFLGMGALYSSMSIFFNDTMTAFYITFIVFIAELYDDVCSHTYITKKYWLRFFYLYQFAFFAHHYRFNGQYSSVALITSWLFIEHSMIYFFHHYELPIILYNAQKIRAQYQQGFTDVQATTATHHVTIITQDLSLATTVSYCWSQYVDDSNDSNLSNIVETEQIRIIPNSPP